MKSDNEFPPRALFAATADVTAPSPVVKPTGWSPIATTDGPAPLVPPPGPARRGLSPFGLPARHSWEIPLLVIVIVATVFAYPFAIFDVAFGSSNEYLALLAFAPIIIWLYRGMTYGQLRTNGVKMSPTQFPEGYRMVQEAAARFGMSHTPDAYVVLGNGVINAFASGHGFRRFIAVHSDLFEIGGRARNPEALAFIIGHEVGHIAAGHTSYWRQIGTVLMGFLPFLGPALSRAQEYTADNHGYCVSSYGSTMAMNTLAAGKYLNVAVGFDEMADRAAHETGFFVWLANAQSSHPVNTWRMWALRDRSRHGSILLRPKPPVPLLLPPKDSMQPVTTS